MSRDRSPLPGEDPVARDRPTVVLGLGVTGRAVARALVRRGYPVVLVDDVPSAAVDELAAELDAPAVVSPSRAQLVALVREAGALVPTPGLGDGHAGLSAAAAAGTPIVGELDLAAAWDTRPAAAVTGTDGKTTVTTLVREMLEQSGIDAIEAGNTEVPMVEAIDDPAPEVFVVEASSFRLAPLRRFAPAVGCWLNFGADHQDVHADLASYEAAKANIWRHFGADQLAVANRDDEVVASHARGLPNLETFGVGPRPAGAGHWSMEGTMMCTPEGQPVVATGEMVRALPHDVANAQAAAATARGVGAHLEGMAAALRSFRGLPHRVQLVGRSGGVTWYDDSKATAPHATLAAVAGFPSVVLIAGGRNKGLDLGMLAGAVPPVRWVVAIGEATSEIEKAFTGHCPVSAGASMDQAVALAADAARPGDVVILSPACASFDWYSGYAQRGDDFVRAAAVIGVPVDPGAAQTNAARSSR